MPRNRKQIPREERASEILTAATEVFLRQGFDGTTVADISRAAGVAPANVYWYYPSKDDVFAAVMDRMLSREIRALEYELQGLGPLPTLIRGLTDMRAFRGLHQAMHYRMQESDAVRDAHDRFLSWFRGNVDRVLDEHPDLADRAMIADIVVSLFEGANVAEPSPRPAKEMISFVLQTLLDQS